MHRLINKLSGRLLQFQMAWVVWAKCILFGAGLLDKFQFFVNGCFWHGHEGCRYYVIPKSNMAYFIWRQNRTLNTETNEMILEAVPEIVKWSWANGDFLLDFRYLCRITKEV